MTGETVEKWKDEAEMGLKLPGLNDVVVRAKESNVPLYNVKSHSGAYSHGRQSIRECLQANKERREIAEHFNVTSEQLRQSQQESIVALTKGHLQANNVNKIYTVSSQERRERKEAKRSQQKKDAIQQQMKDLALFGRELLLDEQAEEVSNATALDFINTVSIEKSLGMLSEYDPLRHTAGGIATVALKEPQSKLLPPPESPILVTKAVRQLIDDEFVRKRDAFHNLKLIDTNLVKPGMNLAKGNGKSKSSTLDELRRWLDDQLIANNCPAQGPDFGRLQLYSACFDRLISEFKVFGPLLAEIKSEYDKLVYVLATDQQELDSLRLKVQQLLNENSNRLLLKLEQQKILQLEMNLQDSHAANEALKKELVEKVAVYASYLPASVYREKREADPLLQTLHNDSKIPNFLPGEDPISKLAAINEETKAVVADLKQQLAKVKHEKEHESVPRDIADALQNDLKTVSDKLAFLQLKNLELESVVQAKEAELGKLESQIKDKEDSYNFLLGEYKTLAEQIDSKSK